jgi:hypothetical protein
MADDVCISTVDCKLQKVIVDHKMLKSIKDLDHKITDILWITSILSNYVILYVLDEKLEIPPIDRNFYFAIIYSITEPNRKMSSIGIYSEKLFSCTF